MTTILGSELTSSKASSFLRINFPARQSPIVNLHTGDSSSEISSIANTSSHSHWVISRQPYLSDVLPCREFVVYKQLRFPCSSVIRCADKLPSSWNHAPTNNSTRKAASSAARKPHKQRSRSNHPEVHTPTVGHVVEDGSCASLM